MGACVSLSAVLSEAWRGRGSLSLCDWGFLCHLLSGFAFLYEQLLSLCFWRAFYASGVTLGPWELQDAQVHVGSVLSRHLSPREVLVQPFSKGGPWTSSSGVTPEFTGNANLGTPPQTG